MLSQTIQAIYSDTTHEGIDFPDDRGRAVFVVGIKVRHLASKSENRLFKFDQLYHFCYDGHYEPIGNILVTTD